MGHSQVFFCRDQQSSHQPLYVPPPSLGSGAACVRASEGSIPRRKDLVLAPSHFWVSQADWCPNTCLFVCLLGMKPSCSFYLLCVFSAPSASPSPRHGHHLSISGTSLPSDGPATDVCCARCLSLFSCLLSDRPHNFAGIGSISLSFPR